MTKARTIRNAALCVAIYLACLLIAWPVAEMGFVDDWSYIRTTLAFSETGRLLFHGWGGALLGWQAVWGALFIHLFGFSFMAAKLSMLPIAVATIILFHLLLLRFQVTGRNAILATLTLALSPYFLPLSVTFMTDIPGLLPIVACLLFCKCAVDATSDRAAFFWLLLAALASDLGGTARQLGWLGALIMVPATAWMLRKRRRILFSAVLVWLASFIFVLFCMAWLGRQPYTIAPYMAAKSSGVDLFILCFIEFAGATLSLLAIVLPVLVPWLAQVRRFKADTLFTISVLVAVIGFIQFVGKQPLPWIGHMIHVELAANMVATNAVGGTGFLLPQWLNFALILFLVFAGLVFLAVVTTLRVSSPPSGSVSSSRELFWIAVPFTFAYLGMLLPIAARGAIYDRYMLGLAPLAILCMVRLYQDRVAPKLPAASIVLLVLMAAFSTAGTHDWFAWQRARLAAIAELTSAGIPRTSFYGGIEYDGWTQIEHGGYINNPWLKNPPGAYKPQPAVSKDDPCGYDFAPYAPTIHAEYTIVFEPKPCFDPSPFAPVTYTSWIPPFRRTIYVQRVPTAQWNGQR